MFGGSTVIQVVFREGQCHVHVRFYELLEMRQSVAAFGGRCSLT
jgi:hypothetical protein